METSGMDYQLAVEGPGLLARTDRALIEVEGRDRASWLHNLTTNQVKTLSVGEGNYSFALNLQGRILLDLNLFVRANSIWIDLDRRFLESAKKHFNKYTITENVTLTDRTNEFARVGVIGRKSAELVASMGVGNAAAMASLAQSVFAWGGVEVGVIRHDFCGPMGFELFVPVAAFPGFEKAVFQGEFGQPVHRISADVVETFRIEAGIPWPGSEITEEYLPAETRQLERGVSYQKGCYLGQEVVERMRSRNVVARQLVGLRMPNHTLPSVGGAILTEGGDTVGKVTSAVLSPSLGGGIALGYVKSAHSGPQTAVAVDAPGGRVQVVVQALPFVNFFKRD